MVATILLTTVAVLGALGAATITTLMHRTTDRLWNAREAHAAAKRVEILLLRNERANLLYGLTGDERHREEALVIRAGLDEALVRANFMPAGAEWNRLVASLREYLEQRDRMETVEPDPVERYRRMSPAMERTVELNEAYIALARHHAQEAFREVTSWNRWADVMAVILVVLFPLAALGMVLESRRLYRHFERLRAAIAAYDPAHPVRAPEEGPAEVQEIAGRFNDLADRLARQRELQMRFFGAVAHDLRTPLAALKTSAQLAARQAGPEDNRTRQRMDAIVRQVERIRRLAEDLLDVARAEAGQLQLQLLPCDLRALARDTVALFEGASPDHDIVLEVPDEPVSFLCDGTRAGQILNNILSNAVKYSPEGGRVVVKVCREGTLAIVSVTDEGVGISEEQRQILFEPFGRAHVGREAIPGAGLGLWTTRRLVEAHAGSIDVESTPRCGSTFTVRFPVAGPDTGR